MPTIKDIAKEAKVSPTTVSNVIHGKTSHVAKETVERITKIIEAYNYTPSLTARSLVSKSSKIIGVINHLIPDQKGNFLEDPFHGAFVGGIEKTLRERGYFMLVRTVEDEQELLQVFRNWNMDGVILTGLFEDTFFAQLIRTDKPIVLVDSYVENKKIFNVGLDDYRGGYIATEYLINHGHKNIVFASPHIQHQGVLEERFRGYQDALTHAGLPIRRENVYEHEMTINEGQELGRELAKRKDITAIFASADMLAAGIISGLQEAGVKVPDEISVIGFDDLYISRVTSPQLTTIHQDVTLKGVTAANMMVDFLEGKPIITRHVVMPVSIVERASVRSLV
ncbi:LacI family DNA-binding transcriptional regulator [Gracilinema caldarium]|uniref:LacI family DNA-binding transcriptional regulator n=1 Tax=Gracilinema caldarium TaxID=215591 RepID=UPI0026F27308|nr:LacI family DNA-binding transcriptional regulator [Gracilinema caldarium]